MARAPVSAAATSLAKLKRTFNLVTSAQETGIRMLTNYLLDDDVARRALNAGADTRPDTRPLDLAGSVVAAIGPLKGKRVIEVNPGPGVMSRQLLAQGPERVLALEEHRRFDETLQDLSRSSNGNFRVLYGDTKTFGNYDKLDTEAGELLEGAAVVPWTQVHPQLHIVAVLPESSGQLTTGRLIRQMAHRGGYYSWGRVPLHALVPQVVCTKLTAKAGEKTRAKLSVLAEIYCDVEVMCTESRKSFGPMPRNDYALVRLLPKVQPAIDAPFSPFKGPLAAPVESLEYVIRQLFVRRGTELSRSINAVGPGATVLLGQAGIRPDQTAMALSADELARLVHAFSVWPDRPVIEDTEVELSSARW